MRAPLAALCVLLGSIVAHAQDGPPAGMPAFDAFERARAVVRGDESGAAAAAVWGAAVTVRGATEARRASTMEFDAARVGIVEELARHVSGDAGPLTVELAGRPVPIPAGPLSSVALSIAPGVDAVAVLVGDRSGVVFPEEMLARGLLPSEAIELALRRALDDRLPPAVEPGFDAWSGYAGRVVREGEATVFRAPVTVLATLGDGGAPTLLHRGGRVVPLSAITPGGLEAWAAQMAAHLRGRLHDGLDPWGLRGTLDARRGAFLSPVDEPFAQALAAYALLRYGSRAWADPDRAAASRRAGEVVLRQLGFVTPVRAGLLADVPDAPLEPAPWADTGAAAMALVALGELDEDAIVAHPELVDLRDRCAGRVRSAVGATLTGEIAFEPSVRANQRALVARALAALGDSGVGRPNDAELGRAAGESILATVETELLVGQLPWLLGVIEATPEQAEALGVVRSLIWTHQLDDLDAAGPDRDMAGGIVFTRGGTPLPTWQSARAVVAASGMLADPRLVPAEARAGEFFRLMRSLRFLRQLSADETLGHLYADPDLALGGVRAALWDQRMPSAATSLALLAVCDALDVAYGVR
ncbi:MAG: hypothetical protein AAFX79_09345 [Planctomycetota bacterium]